MWAALLINTHLNIVQLGVQAVVDDSHTGSLLPGLLLLALPGGPVALGKRILRSSTLTWRRHDRGQSCEPALSQCCFTAVPHC